MLSLTVLGSGSAGNCAVVETPGCRLLVDAGLSARQIGLRLEAAGLQPEQIDGVLLTHEHIDHIGGIDVFCKKFPVPIFCNPLTGEALSRVSREECRNRFRFFQTGSEFTINDLTVQTFAIPHDAADPVGFVLRHDSSALGFCTDLGVATKLVMERLREVQTLVIETNHDEKMLQSDTRRPWPVKQRIMSRHGHLSNTAAADVIASLLGNGLRRAVLGHLSRDCNRPDLALDAVRSRLAKDGVMDEIEVFCASQTEHSPRFSI